MRVGRMHSVAAQVCMYLLVGAALGQSFLSSYSAVCPRVECVFADSRQGRKCIEAVSDELVKVSALACSPHEECTSLGGNSAVCLAKTEEEKKLLFPGEYCDMLEEVTYCAFGPQV